MYKCIKVREIESALCCLPSVPGQCNELASISKGDLEKKQQQKKQQTNNVGFRPLKLLLEKKEEEKQRPAMSSYNLSGNQVQGKVRSCSSYRKQG